MDSGAQITGTRDEHYALISVLYHTLHGAETCHIYALDAEAGGRTDLYEFFREAQVAQTGLAERAKELLGIGGAVGAGPGVPLVAAPPETDLEPQVPPEGGLPSEAPPESDVPVEARSETRIPPDLPPEEDVAPPEEAPPDVPPPHIPAPPPPPDEEQPPRSGP